MKNIAYTKRKTVMIVDDSPLVLAAAKEALSEKYTVVSVTSAALMFHLLADMRPDLILIDVEMPDANGFDAIKRLKRTPTWKRIPVIFLAASAEESGEFKGLCLGVADYVTKPFSSLLLLQYIENHFAFAGQAASKKTPLPDAWTMPGAEGTPQKRTAPIAQAASEAPLAIPGDRQSYIIALQNAIIDIVANLVEFRDGCTGSHIFRTQQYMEILLREILREDAYAAETKDWNPEFLIHSVQLHDVGKIAISDKILQKPGALTNEEYQIMHAHVPIGLAIIDKIEEKVGESTFLRHARRVTGTHHEKWDGTGYPNGLAGEDIPLEGRLMAIADVYDALVTERPYKAAFSTDQAREIIRDGAGTHFDPALAAHFLKVSGDFAEVVKHASARDTDLHTVKFA